MEKIVLDIPDEVLISLKETSEEFSKEIRMLAAVHLYQIAQIVIRTGCSTCRRSESKFSPLTFTLWCSCF